MAPKSNISNGLMEKSSQPAKKERMIVFDETIFQMGVLGYLRTYGQIDDDTTDDDKQATVREAIELWEISAGIEEYHSFPTAVEALSSFAQWNGLASYKYEKPPVYRLDGFTVSITIPTRTAGTTATFTYHGTPLQPDIEIAMKEAYKELSDFAQKSFAAKPQSNQPNKQTPANKIDDESIEFVALRCQSYQNKLVFRIIPSEGAWQQFGIPLYADEAKKAGINLKDYSEEGDYDLTGSAMVQMKPDGKPMRVHSIETD